MNDHFRHIDKLNSIIQKHIKGISLDGTEKEYLDRWLNESVQNKKLFEKFYYEEELADSLQLYHTTDTDEQLKIVQNRIKFSQPSRSISSKWYAVAASVLLALSIGCWFYFKNQALDQEKSIAIQDVMPGTNRAVLTLSSGKSINLDEKQNEIAISADGISYADGNQIANSENSQFAKLQTPRGGTYSIKLPDGTKVWLNAGSELEYPLHFTGATREVKLKGEGYFEVTHDKSHPFIVSTDIQKVKVLGTTFNIRAYTNRQATTLITGKVSVSQKGNQSEIKITPGEQASINNGNIQVTKVDVTDFTAWKEGLLSGSSAKFNDIADEIERWYDVDFVYPAGFKNNEQAFFSVSKNEKLSSVLKALERTYGIHFQIKGKEVLIKQ